MEEPDHQQQEGPCPVQAADHDSDDFPACVTRAATAVESLLRATRAPFPDLGVVPQTIEELVQILRQARDWGKAVHEAFGDPASNHRTPGSVWALFERSNRQGLTARLVSRPSLTLRRISLASHDAVRCEIHGLDEFQLRTEPTGLPHHQTIESAADVLGDIPPEFHHSCAPTLGNVLGPEWMSILDDRGELINVPLSLSEWSRVQKTLRYEQRVVLMKSLGLADWVRTRIKNLSNTLFLGIRIVRNLRHNKHEVALEQAGTSRTATLTHAQTEFLRRLVKEGECSTFRKTKSELVKLLPELGPWIETDLGRKGLSAENEARYRLTDGARKHIHFVP